MFEKRSSPSFVERCCEAVRLMTASSKPIRWAAALFIGICMMLYFGFPSFPSKSSFSNPASAFANYVSAQELMARPLSQDLQSIPKLFHQSWSSTVLPYKFEKWSATCRAKHPDWEWVLWTDKDNLELVTTHFPWFLETFQKLPGVINRADVARNMYMYLYGGVYADLDMECLRPLDHLLESYNMSTVSHESTFSKPPAFSNSDEIPLPRTAFLGRMGTDEKFGHSIPNAWMASTPGQPFWLLAIEGVQQALLKKKKDQFIAPEELTGPIALRELTILYQTSDDYKDDRLDKHIEQNPTAVTTYGARPDLPHRLIILPHYYIYPFSWGRDGDAVKEYCEVSKPHFNSDRCKKLIGVDAWPSYMVTYWSHSWGLGNDHGKNVNLLDTDD